MSHHANELSGDLEFIGLGDVLQFLGSHGSTGVLTLSCPAVAHPGLVSIENGNPIDATVGPERGLKALLALFGWVQGRFDFSCGLPHRERTIHKGRMEIILDGLRMLDDGQIAKIGPAESSPGADGPAAADRDDTGPLIKGPLVDYMYVVAEEEFYDGETIIEEGNHGSWIWVVLEGVVEMTRSGEGGTRSVAKIGDGGFVGSIASFLVRESVRTMSARALGNVQLGVMDSKRLTREYAAMSPELRALVLSLDRRLHALARQLGRRTPASHPLKELVKTHKLVIKQGTDAPATYRVAAGSAIAARRVRDRLVTLVTFEPDDIFGRMPFADLSNDGRLASVLTSSDFQAVRVDDNLLAVEYRELSPTFRNILENMSTLFSVMALTVCDAVGA